MENKLKIVLCAENSDDLIELVRAVSVKYNRVCAEIDNINIENKIKRFDSCDAVFIMSCDKDIDQSILDKWMGHPHLRCVINRNKTGWINDLSEEIDCLLNHIEYEKKFLIKIPDTELLLKYSPFTVDIEQIYLTCPNGSHRIRKRGTKGTFSYFETKKIRITKSKCFEYENSISPDDYEKLKAIADKNKHPIVKKRTCFLYKGQYFELDVFEFFTDKALLELELKNEMQPFELPPEIEVIKDVSESKKYKNNYLAGITNYDNY